MFKATRTVQRDLLFDDDSVFYQVFSARGKTKQPSNKNYQNSAIKKQLDTLTFASDYALYQDPNLMAEKQMEDVALFVSNFNNRKERGLFILCDGHGGDKVADYVGKKLADSVNFALFGDGERDKKRAFIDGFSKLDKDLSSFPFSLSTGTSCTTLFFFNEEDLLGNDKSYLAIANVGDTKALLINNTGYSCLTTDHSCSNRNEVKRVIQNGGFIFEDKINGELKLSRCFGHTELKKYGLIVKPDYSCRALSNSDSYVILASRGIWEFVTEYEVVSIVNKGFVSIDIAESIAMQARVRGSDKNISVFVIKIN